MSHSDEPQLKARTHHIFVFPQTFGQGADQGVKGCIFGPKPRNPIQSPEAGQLLQLLFGNAAFVVVVLHIAL